MMADLLMPNKKIKQYIEDNTSCSSAELEQVLSDYVRHCLKEAVKRARAAGRKTIRGSDV